jgi:hypothetical protein
MVERAVLTTLVMKHDQDQGFMNDQYGIEIALS